jgi:hypothetical protein
MNVSSPAVPILETLVECELTYEEEGEAKDE